MRYYADTYDAEGLPYIFDEADGGAVCCGPFADLGNAEQTANDLNTDNTHPMGLRPHMIQRRLHPDPVRPDGPETAFGGLIGQQPY